MSEIKIVSNGGTGAMFLGIDPITRKEIIKLGLNDKHSVLVLQKTLNDFVAENYKNQQEVQK